ncbi:MAG: hypothetical protein RLP15_10680 [Cryomorphaceae bacterium]
MDDIGNIVYLVVLLLSFVYGIWKKANKSNEESSRPAANTEEYDGDFTEVFTPQSPAAPEVVKPEAQAPRVVMDREQIDRARIEDREAALQLRFMEGKARSVRDEISAERKRKRRSLQVLEAAEEEERRQEYNDEEFEFDARKAVIYSDILNPPYI